MTRKPQHIINRTPQFKLMCRLHAVGTDGSAWWRVWNPGWPSDMFEIVPEWKFLLLRETLTSFGIPFEVAEDE
jgi:hypothetical protein